MLIFISGALQMFIAFDLGIPLQGIYPKEIFRCKTFTLVLLVTENWK